MLVKNRIIQLIAYALGVLLVWILVGCGGAGGGAKVGPAKVALQIAWPKPTSSRYIPPYAKSLAFSLYSLDISQQPINLVVNRPDTLPVVQTVEFTGPIPAGNYVLQGIAKVGFNGLGDTVASAISPVLVPATGTTTVALALSSTLYELDLQDMPLSMVVGDSQQLIVKVLDKDHNQVFLPGGALTWSLLYGADAVSLSDSGFVSAIGPGAAIVRVSEVGAGLYTDGDINVVAAGKAAHRAAHVWKGVPSFVAPAPLPALHITPKVRKR